MTNPITPASLRGAVDLSSLARPANQAGRTAPATAGSVGSGQGTAAQGSAGQQSAGGAGSPAVRDVTTEQFGDFISQSTRFPVIVALWSSSQPSSRAQVDLLAEGVHAQAGKFMLGRVDIDTDPEVAQAFQQLGQQAGLPAGTTTVVAFIAGQPAPIPPISSAGMVDDLLTQLGQMAVANGITGRVPGDFSQPASGADATDGNGGPEDQALSPLAEKAYAAIESGDYDTAIAAYEEALKDNPGDEDARLGLGQVRLLQRTAGVDLQTARADAAEHPQDVAKQALVADLDVLGGHVEDAFARLIDVVRATAGDERNQAREHLIGLFDVVGASDPRVKKARTALMSALY